MSVPLGTDIVFIGQRVCYHCPMNKEDLLRIARWTAYVYLPIVLILLLVWWLSH